MNEDRFEEFLREGLADYNRPPEPPTEAMWSRIEAARVESTVKRASPRRALGLPVWGQWAAGLAATLVVGIALGRLSLGRSPGDGASPAAARPAVEPTASPVATGRVPETRREETDRTGGSAGSAEEGPERVANAAPGAGGVPRAGAPSRSGGRSSAAPAQAAPRLAGAAGLSSPAPGPSAGGEAERAASARYRFAALRTFGQAEALLTAVRTAPADSVDYQQLSEWARDVLAQTRLLIDSPAGRDPVLGRLLSDLELVLVQVAGLADDRDTDRDLIQGAIRQRDVLPRLRAAVPAGSSIGT